MAKRITKIVLTGGPAAGKTTLVSRVLKEFKQEDGWRVITIPETATELISGFGIKPFDNCMSMLQFQDFVVGDQIHKEKLGFTAEQMLVLDDLKPGYDMAKAANVRFAAAGWSNDIPEIEAFMRQNCDLYFKTIETFGDYLLHGKEA